MKMVALKRDERRVFNDSLRSHKGYRNPDLLTKLVEHWGVDQYGSAFDQAVFDPKGLPEEDKIGEHRSAGCRASPSHMIEKAGSS